MESFTQEKKKILTLDVQLKILKISNIQSNRHRYTRNIDF